MEQSIGVEKRSRTWAFTVQSPADIQYITLENLEDSVKWLCYAQERGEDAGELHLQGAVAFKHAKSFSAAFKILGLDHKTGDHLAEQNASQFTNAAYCLKGTQSKAEWETDGVDGEHYGEGLTTGLADGLTTYHFYTVGDIPKRSDGAKESIWDEIVEKVKNGWSNLELMERYPATVIRCQAAVDKYRLQYERSNAEWRDVTTTYLSGDTGVGKTRYVMETFGYNNVYRVQNYHAGAFDQYDGQEVILFEEFRSSFKIEQMLNFLDGYPLELPARYADKFAKFTKVFICTNWAIDEQYRSIQENHPKTWDAFIRRIDNFAIGFTEEGVPILDQLV